jgi:predicted N-acetyltransferase YhbS
MEILPYEPEMADRLTTAYNSAIRGVPHCYPASTAELTAALADPLDLRESQVFVALEDQSVVGFVHASIGFIEGKEHPERGLIRFLWYAPGHRRAGQALLKAAEDHLRAHGMDRAFAFHGRYRYPFYHLGGGGLSIRLGQVAALLGYSGYQRVGGEMILDWPNYEPLEPSPAGVTVEVTAEWRPGEGAHPELRVYAYQVKRAVARAVAYCKCISFDEFTTAAEAQDWLLVTWIGVGWNQREKGLGSHLLRRALLEMHGAGYRHATIGAEMDDYRATLFYNNFGFHVVDWAYGLSRMLEG